MPTVRLRDASEYPAAAQKLFELSKLWFGYDFPQPPAMSRVMAWDAEVGGAPGRVPARREGDGRRGGQRRQRLQLLSPCPYCSREAAGNEGRRTVVRGG